MPCPTIPNTVVSIGIQAFYQCNSLGTIVIPESVTNIADYAFYNTATWAPDTIVMMGNTPPTIQSYTFNINAIKEIVLKPGDMDAYVNATNWSALASKMVERTV
jgi:hypothetical protein